jgi:hypothetical protein
MACGPDPLTCEERATLSIEQADALADVILRSDSGGNAELLNRLFFAPQFAIDPQMMKRQVVEYLLRRHPCNQGNNAATEVIACDDCDDPACNGDCEKIVYTGCDDPEQCNTSAAGWNYVNLARAAERSLSLPYIPLALSNLQDGDTFHWDADATPDNVQCDPCADDVTGTGAWVNGPAVVDTGSDSETPAGVVYPFHVNGNQSIGVRNWDDNPLSFDNATGEWILPVPAAVVHCDSTPFPTDENGNWIVKPWGMRFLGESRYDAGGVGISAFDSAGFPISPDVNNPDPLWGGTHIDLVWTNDTGCTMELLVGPDVQGDVVIQANTLWSGGHQLVKVHTYPVIDGTPVISTPEFKTDRVTWVTSHTGVSDEPILLTVAAVLTNNPTLIGVTVLPGVTVTLRTWLAYELDGDETIPNTGFSDVIYGATRWYAQAYTAPELS